MAAVSGRWRIGAMVAVAGAGFVLCSQLWVRADEGWTAVLAVDGGGALAAGEVSRLEAVAGVQARGRVVCRSLALSPDDRSATKAASIRGLVAEGARSAGGGRLIVGIRGHGSGALGGTAGILSGSSGGGVTAPELAAAIGAGLRDGGRERADLVVLEVCRSAAAEVAAELAPHAGRCALIAGDLAEPGLSWASTVRALARTENKSLSAAEIVDALVERVAKPGSPAAGVVLVDLGSMRELKSALGAVVAAGRRDERAVYWALGDTWGRLGGGHRPGVTLGGLCQRISEASRDKDLREAADRLAQLADRAQLRTWRLGGEEDWSPLLTLYVPGPVGGDIQAYEQCSTLALSTGYASLLRAYERHCLQSLPVSWL